MISICNCHTEAVLYQLFCCDFCWILQVLGKSLTGLPHLRVKFKTENIQLWNVLLSSHKLYKHLPMHTCIIEIKYKCFIKHVIQILTITHYFVKPKPFLQSMQNEWKSTVLSFFEMKWTYISRIFWSNIMAPGAPDAIATSSLHWYTMLPSLPS